ncbi:ACP phosphodiesterase [Formosa sp. Hel1_33_131]|jgi:acyl carrier protein phosphodiesterase|uniref:acyl carrier protein phosphodiesterase n=1 Tax=Formosa sp. Hel1_33_131 TaxID=1336794 RepID=UPI00084E0DCC|nr:acyl carrier protein phosphodiesterase [Formosa sp. Hel1_33_131]AOR27140.1 ACP phosphodiesterase [Formosa sp. Hel1_33_131]
MNYLAHIFLSGGQPDIMIGNFIADSIKGSKYDTYPPEIQKGILLHRQIDTTTDAHPAFRQSTKRLHKNYGHYSGIIVDIFYDHFLAKNWSEYSDIPLADYIQSFYKLLRDNFEILPANIQKIAPIMMEGNWLLIYAELEGIDRVLAGMNRRTKNRSGMDKAGQELKEFYTLFEADFRLVIKDLQTLSDDFLAS